MDDRTIMVILRLIHFIAGIFWVGGSLITAGFLLPSVRATGADAGRFMQHVTQRRRLPIYMNVAAALTVLSGFAMYGLFVSASSEWAATRQAMILGIGGLAALVAAIVGGAVAAPAARRMAALGQRLAASGGSPSPADGVEMGRLQARLGLVSKVVATLLLVSVAAMASARYL
jgi:uncharacterized membrane protein